MAEEKQIERQLMPEHEDDRLRPGWPLSWAPRLYKPKLNQATGALMQYEGPELQEAKRKTDREDAPRVIEWRGHKLLRQPNLSDGGYECYGFENRAQYSGPSPVFWTEITCDGGRASIVLQGDVEPFCFEGKGENEIEALDAAAVDAERFIAELRCIIGVPPQVVVGSRVRVITERTEWHKIVRGRLGTVKKIEIQPNGEEYVAVAMDEDVSPFGNIQWQSCWFKREDLQVVEK